MTYGVVEHPVADWKYHTVQENLRPEEIARLICKIQGSKDYDLGELGHIFIADSKVVVGYIGDDRVDLVEPRNRESHQHHNSLIELIGDSLI